MDYLRQPIDIQGFDQYLRMRRGEALREMIFVAFTQTDATWKATYQDAEVNVTFRGSVSKLLLQMQEYTASKEKENG